MIFDHQLIATRGFHPHKRTPYSIATRGYSIWLRLGIKLMSLITGMFTTTSTITTKVEESSPI